MSQPSSKAGFKGKSTRLDRPSQLPSSESVVSVELFPYVRTALEAGRDMSNRAREVVETLRSELQPWVGEIETGEVVDLDAVHAALYSEVKAAVQTADLQIDKLCFKRRPSPPAEAKKGVTAALEQLAEEVWKAVAEGTEKPLTLQLAHLFPGFDTLITTVDALHRTLEDILIRVESSQTSVQEPKPSSIPLSSPDLPKTEETKEAELAKNPASIGLSKPTDKPKWREIREEMEIMLGELQALGMAKGRNEDSEAGRLKREIGKVKLKLQGLCKSMEEEEIRSPSERSLHRSNVPGSSDDLTEHSHPSFHPPSALTIDTEDIKLELTRHLRDSQSTVITALIEQKQGIDTVAQAQANMQSKQDALTAEVAEIRKKLNEVFPASTLKGKKMDFSRGLTVLRTLFPDIRAANEQDFVDKFVKQVMEERAELEQFLGTVRSEGYSFLTLEELAREFVKLKASVINLQEEREDALLKMIRVQSEFEIETEFQKARANHLESELSQLRDSALSTDEAALLKSKVDELTIENARLRGDAFDLSSVEPPVESIDDYSKNDELAFLKLQLHQKKERLARLFEDRKAMDSRAATPSEVVSLGDRCEREAADIKRLTRQIQTIEGSQDVADSLATRELEMKPVDERLASHIMTLLNLTGAFEICGTVSFGEDMWALVKVGNGFVWVKSALDRYKLSNEEMIVQCAQATKMLEVYPNLPRSLVLALGQLMTQTEVK